MSFAFASVQPGSATRELLAAVAGERVARPELGDPGGRALLEQPVAGLVAALVVVVLEEVEVEHRDAERIALRAGARQLARQLLLPAAAVEQPREVIGARDLLEPREQVGALERHRGLGGEHAHRRGDPADAVDLAAPADDQHRDGLLVAQHGLEMHRDGAGRHRTTRCEIRSSPRASWTKSGFFEQEDASPRRTASSPSETFSGGAPWSP